MDRYRDANDEWVLGATLAILGLAVVVIVLGFTSHHRQTVIDARTKDIVTQATELKRVLDQCAIRSDGAAECAPGTFRIIEQVNVPTTIKQEK